MYIVLWCGFARYQLSSLSQLPGPCLTHWAWDEKTTFRIQHFQTYFPQWKCLNFNKNSLKFVPKGLINNIPVHISVQIMSWPLWCDKPLSNQWWLVYRRIYASPGLNELNIKTMFGGIGICIVKIRWLFDHLNLIFIMGILVYLLTHWGRVTHICVCTNTNIGSDNGLLPGGRQAIIWTNAGILLLGPLGTNFSGILSEIHTFSFKKMHFKTSSAK